MSTAEQITPVRILAKHRLDDFDGTCTCGEWSYEDEPYDPADPELASMHSAHVVAALTNAATQGDIALPALVSAATTCAECMDASSGSAGS
ncbi:hypothetical protein GS464_16775 [Rhodococcus hoagii]|nr:hypothetical protein [Prescottella equi]